MARRWELRNLIPLILAVAGTADLATRFLPSDRWMQSGFDAVNRWSHRDGTVEHSRRYESDRAYGELALMGNRPEFVHYRHEVFTTDIHGYRNPEGLGQKGVDAILVGSSFSLGLANSDQDTLSSQLTARGIPIYNASLVHGTLSLARIRSVARILHVKRGVVLLEFLNRAGLTRAWLKQPLDEGEPALDRTWSIVKGVSKDPLRSLVSAAWRRSFENDVILPNSAAAFVTQARLRNHEPFLFYPPDIQFFEHPTPVDTTRDALVWLAGELNKEGLELRVLLAPTSYTVYAPLLEGGSADTGGEWLARLDAGLNAAGIRTRNALPRLRREAEAALARNEYLYWRDDAHWNAHGIAVVADDLASWWQPVNREPQLAGNAQGR